MFKSPWANLAAVLAVALLVAIVVVHMVKIVDFNGRDGGQRLSFMPKSTSPTPVAIP